MKINTGILVGVLMFTLGLSKFVPDSDCIFEQLLEANTPYYIYSPRYPEYFHGERRCRYSGRLPHYSLRLAKPWKINVACTDIDFPADESCPAYVSSIRINVYKNASYFHDYHGSNTRRKCGPGGMETTHRTERIDIDWNSNKTRGRFSCRMIAMYQLKSCHPLNVAPDQFSKTPPPTRGCTCGRENVPEKTIRGSFGYEAAMNQYPFMAALIQYKGSESKLYCGASIISQRYALSSAQCRFYNDRDGGTLKLRVGVHDIRKENGTNYTKTYEIEMKQHEQWSSNDVYFNDIMLIKTEELIEFNYGVGAVCLPYSGDLSYSQPEVKILGWGRELQFLKEIRRKQTTNCHRPDVDETIADRRLCTRNYTVTGDEPNEGTCVVDIGGPLIWKNVNLNKNILLGILTLPTCLPHQVDIFTRVTRYLDWILANAQGYIYLNCNHTVKNQEGRN